MTSSSRECTRVERRKIRAEAAAWLARLHGPNRTPAMEEGLRRWLAQDPIHAREFELATDVWDESGGHGTRVPTEQLPSRRHFHLPRLLVPLGAFVAAAIIMVCWVIQAHGTVQVSTGIGEQRTIILADGSRLTLNTNTQAEVRYTKQARTVTLRTGEAYFDVVHNSHRPFIVRAGDQKIVDLGTRFIVSRTAPGANSLSVTVVEGRVAVAPVGDMNMLGPKSPPRVRIVTAGHLLKFRAGSFPALHSVSLDSATAWLNGQLVFDDTPLSEAAAEFNRYSSVKIRVLSGTARRLPVGGVFRIGDSASFARAVAESDHLTLITRRNELLLEPPTSDAHP